MSVRRPSTTACPVRSVDLLTALRLDSASNRNSSCDRRRSCRATGKMSRRRPKLCRRIAGSGPATSRRSETAASSSRAGSRKYSFSRPESMSRRAPSRRRSRTIRCSSRCVSSVTNGPASLQSSCSIAKAGYCLRVILRSIGLTSMCPSRRMRSSHASRPRRAACHQSGKCAQSSRPPLHGRSGTEA